MGQKPAEIESELERQRHALSARIGRLERRVRDDASTTRENLAGRASGIVDSATSVGGKVAGVAGTTAGSDTAIAEHPKGVVTAAGAAGFLAGLLTGNGSDDKASDRSRDHAKQKNGTGAHTSSEGTASKGESHDGGLRQTILDAARGFVAAQTAAVVESTIESVKDAVKQGKSSSPKHERPRELPDSDFAYEQHFGAPPPLRPAATAGRRES